MPPPIHDVHHFVSVEMKFHQQFEWLVDNFLRLFATLQELGMHYLYFQGQWIHRFGH